MNAATTPTQVSHFVLLQVRARLKLECAGMQSRGGATRPKVAAMLGLKPRDSYEKFLKVIGEKIEESLENVREEAQMAGEAHNAAINS